MTAGLRSDLRGVPWLNSSHGAGRVLALLDCDGEEARAVGGAVRNALLGEPVADIDIATTAVPERVMARAAGAGLKTIPTGLAHGTVTVVVDGEPFEVTTLREDVETFGRQARVAFGRDWDRDAHRRDFTINALSVSRDGTVHDYVGGLKDIASRRVRFIGDPGRRIAEDFLRILRFFRFHAAYGDGDMDRAGLNACAAGRAGMNTLSAERIRNELLKLLVARGAPAAIETMSAWGLLMPLIAGVPYQGALATMIEGERTACLDADPMRRLAALAAAKPEDALRLSQHLRLSRAETARLESMAERWWRIDPADEADAKGQLYHVGAERYRDRVMMGWARGVHRADDARWLDLVDLPRRWLAPPLPFQAADFMARGIAAGPKLGEALAFAEDQWISAGFPDDSGEIKKIADAAAKRFM